MEKTFWIHGIEGDSFDPRNIQTCIDDVQEQVGDEINWTHRAFNWNQEVHDREMILWNRVKKRGNFLTRQIRKGICFQGCDLWWSLQTLRDGTPGFINSEVQRRLEQLVTAVPYKTVHLICHSWGNFVGLRYIIDHPEQNFNLISMGNPLFYGSGAYQDWGDPMLLQNIKSWTNIAIKNDPIASLASDNPNGKWSVFVKDFELSFLNPFPIRTHGDYWNSAKCRKIIVDALKNFKS